MGNCWIKFVEVIMYHNDDEPEPELAGGNVHLITTMENWDQKLSEASRDGKIVVANFSAPWCQPCHNIKQSYIETADKYRSLLFLTVDVDELGELSTKWGVRATPTFFFLKHGQTIDKLVGGNKEDLLKKIAGVTDLATESYS